MRIRIEDLTKFVTDPDPDRNSIRIRIQAKQDSVAGKSEKFNKRLISHVFCVYITKLSLFYK